MHRALIVGLGIGIPVVIFTILAFLDLNSAQQLQFLTVENEEFDFMDLSMDTSIAVCNPSFFPTSFEKVEAILWYKSTELGYFTLWGDSVGPNEAVDLTGRFGLDGKNVLQLFLGGVLTAFSGSSPEYDPNDFSVNMKIEKKILGIIPFTIEEKGDISKIRSMFANSDQGEWNCGYSPKLRSIAHNYGINPDETDFKQLLALYKQSSP